MGCVQPPSPSILDDHSCCNLDWAPVFIPRCRQIQRFPLDTMHIDAQIVTALKSPMEFDCVSILEMTEVRGQTTRRFCNFCSPVSGVIHKPRRSLFRLQQSAVGNCITHTHTQLYRARRCRRVQATCALRAIVRLSLKMGRRFN